MTNESPFKKKNSESISKKKNLSSKQQNSELSKEDLKFLMENYTELSQEELTKRLKIEENDLNKIVDDIRNRVENKIKTTSKTEEKNRLRRWLEAHLPKSKSKKDAIDSFLSDYL